MFGLGVFVPAKAPRCWKKWPHRNAAKCSGKGCDMTFKTVLTVRMKADDPTYPLLQAERVATHTNGHLDVLCIGVDHTRTSFYDATASAITIQAGMEQAQGEAKETRRKTEETMRASTVAYSVESTVVHGEEVGRLVAHHARFSDLLVARLPYGRDRLSPEETVVEAALFDARVPVLLLPDEAKAPLTPRCITLAWDQSIEALTAAKKALPMLMAADLVRIVIIDPPQHGPERSDPGGALCQLLARHGVNCEIDILSKTLPRVSDTLLRHASDTNSDLIVMGAYGHSRFREALLGGTTRSILERADRPVFMAH